MKTLFLTITFAVSLAAQTTPFIKGGAEIGGGLGYRPGATIGAGVDHQRGRLLLLAESAVSTANKMDTGNGTSIKASGAIYWKWRGIFPGAGLRCTRLFTSAYEKGSCRPFTGLAVQRQAWRVRADYLFHGTDTLNHLQGPRAGILLRMTERLDLEYEVGAYRFNPSFGTGHLFGMQSNISLRLRLRK